MEIGFNLLHNRVWLLMWSVLISLQLQWWW